MPLGNLTSQFFANVYLNELDKFVKHSLRIKLYIRYVDDFVIFCNDKQKLSEYWGKLQQYLSNDLKLELHPAKSRIISLKNGMPFVGYRIFYYHRLLKRSNKRSFEKQFKHKLQQYAQKTLILKDIENFLTGWQGYARWANAHRYFQEARETVEKLK